jgi:hypothetical protein
MKGAAKSKLNGQGQVSTDIKVLPLTSKSAEKQSNHDKLKKWENKWVRKQFREIAKEESDKREE